MKNLIFIFAIIVSLMFSCQSKSGPNGTNSVQKTSNSTSQETSNTPKVYKVKLGDKVVELETWYKISYGTRIIYKEINGMIYGFIKSDVYGGTELEIVNFTKDKAELDYYNNKNAGY